MTIEKTLAEFIQENGIESKAVPATCNPNFIDPNWKGFHWLVVLKMGTRTFQVFYSTGTGLVDKRTKQPLIPTAQDILNSVKLDSQCVEYSTFEDWAQEFGYSSDSISAKKTYDICQEQRTKLRNFLGREAYNDLIENVESL